MTLGETISYYRKKAGLSQETLAERIGVSRQSVSKWELNEATPEVGKLKALAGVFGVTVDRLLSGTIPDEKPAEPTGEYRAGPPPEESGPPKKRNLIERMAKKYGWLAGVYIALEGLGVALVGGLARWAFGQFFRVGMESLGGFGMGTGGMTITMNGQPVTDPELYREIANQLPGGFGSFDPGVTMLTGAGRIFVGIATVILVVGLLWMIAGIVLAIVLYRKGKS